ncbi:hypothetical protein MMC29_000209 [Sticta canariensis]|nr:hypothetical protein [Sticta canariensis]
MLARATRTLPSTTQIPPYTALARSYSSVPEPNLKTTLEEAIPAKRELYLSFKERPRPTPVVGGQLRLNELVGGLRGVTTLLWEGSSLDPYGGIRFRGKTIKSCQEDLPKGTSGTEMLPEAMFWLLLTGQVPSASQVRVLSRELAEKSALPRFVEDMLDTFPSDLHPMTQFACTVSALNQTSVFAKAYEKGMQKEDYWKTTFEDSLSLLAKLPTIAAKIYQNSYRGGGALPAEVDLEQDWSYNFAAMLGKGGKENEGFQDLLRLYLALHGDHEGGNVSAHTTHLVGSALSDPFLSYSAGLQGLAGPLHGLAAQEVLRWILKMQSSIGTSLSEGDIGDFIWATLEAGQVIPGYGHAVLRQPDPRFEALMAFATSRPEIGNNPLFQLVEKSSKIVPRVLLDHRKSRNPNPNVDSASGVLFHHFGFQETLYYTVIFGVSRGLGALAQLIWDRALGVPIERPRSITLADLKARLDDRINEIREGTITPVIRRVGRSYSERSRRLMVSKMP